MLSLLYQAFRHLCDQMETCPSWLLLSLVNVLQTSLQFSASSGQSKQKVAWQSESVSFTDDPRGRHMGLPAQPTSQVKSAPSVFLPETV